MKSSKNTNKQLTPAEMAEALVYPDMRSKGDRDEAIDELKKVRKKYAAEQTAEDKLVSQLLQLRFLMEDYLIREDLADDHLYFGYFLKEYIRRLDKKNKEFAEEIDVDPTELSQIINKHRKATEKIIFRLDIHSNKNFPALLWFRVLQKDRVIELHNDPGIIESEGKFVKRRLQFSFKG
jgi:hypothetical protein